MINGAMLRDMVISAANNIDNQKQAVNDLNVFPVPDGDTGTNMSLTIKSARDRLYSVESNNLSEVADIIASSLIKGARGNSGVILSLFFRGISQGFKGLASADSAQIANAFDLGVKSAYKAVMKPTEGTILTVARVSAEETLKLVKSKKAVSVNQVFDNLLVVASDTLKKTPDMLPVLKQAKVVDSGGRGYEIILEGMVSALNGVIIQATEQPEITKTSEKADFNSFETADIKFQYCTEFLLYKNEADKEADGLKQYLSMLGDSLVYVDAGDFIKIHVHTNNPGKALEKACTFGQLDKLKIENMKIQHTTMSEEQATQPLPEQPKDKSAFKEYGFVSVCAGDGLKAVFSDLAVDEIINGGQTMNPSTADILEAIEKVEAKTVFVLPNNKNIIMAAEQAAPISDKNVVVIPTKTVPQGLSALFNFNPEASVEENTQAMRDAIDTVATAQVTFAARDSEFEDKKIKKDQILGLMENKVTYVTDSIDQCIESITNSLKEKDAGYFALFYGCDVTEEQAQKTAEKMTEILGDDVEISVINGGQPIYYYIISAE